MISLVHPVAAQSDKLGYLRIRAEYPVQVPRSYLFQINVTVEYAFHDYFQIRAAIYEGATGILANPLWESQAELLGGVSEQTYNVQLRSPAGEGQWVLTGYAFFQNDSAWKYFTDQERGPGLVEINIKVADNAKLTLQTPHANMSVTVDGADFSTDQNGLLVREVKVLTDHSVAVPSNVSLGEGWRAFFVSWNGTDHGNPKTLLVAADTFLTVQYQDQFRLDVVSTAGHVQGGGWYRSGEVANFSVPMLVPQEGVAGLVGVRWQFTGWSGDIDSPSNSESIVMDRPHKVVANWTVDYQQFYYVIIGIIVLVAAALAAFVARRAVSKKPPAEKTVEETAEETPAEKASEEMTEGTLPEETTEGTEPAPPARAYCMHCGAEIDPDAKFCSKCGKSQVSSD